MRVIQGGNHPKPYRGKTKESKEPITCPKCSGSSFVQMIHSPDKRGWKWLKRSGYTALHCPICKIDVATDK